MASGRPLHELLSDLVGDADAARAHGAPEAYLAANGHPDLPPDLVAEAVVSYADTAPVDVAEHLAPYVMTHSAVPAEPADEPPAQDWFGLLTTAPEGPPELDDMSGDLSAGPDDGAGPWSPDSGSAHHDPAALDFGSGSVDDGGAPADDSPDGSPDDSADDSGPSSAADDADGQEDAAWNDLEPENVDLDVVPADDADETGDLDDLD